MPAQQPQQQQQFVVPNLVLPAQQQQQDLATGVLAGNLAGHSVAGQQPHQQLQQQWTGNSIV